MELEETKGGKNKPLFYTFRT